MPAERIYDVLVSDWMKMVDQGWTSDARYLHQAGRPVVQIWGFYWNDAHNRMTADLANKLIDFFKKPGPYSALLIGGGTWDWRQVPQPGMAEVLPAFRGLCPVEHRQLDA